MLRPRWNNAEIMSYQRWNNIETTLCNGWDDVVQRWFSIASMLTSTLYQCSATLNIRFQILFHFQRRINVIWTVIYNVETTLIWRWNVGRVVSMEKLILRTILPATLLTKWNLQLFFKDYAKTLTIPHLTNFFWWLLLRIRLWLVVSNSSGLQKVPS